MAKTNAQRQAEYRKKRAVGQTNECRINTWISLDASIALDRLACNFGLTRRDMLEKLLTDADNRIIKKLELNSHAWNEYFGATQ